SRCGPTASPPRLVSVTGTIAPDFFFFQAEDGIRDGHVTGVQTCALPILIIAPDIGFYRERKLRLLNGAHTATAPLALLAGVRTVREAAEHPRLGAFLRHILFEEIVPATDLPADAAVAFAGTVIDRFRNPWLDHEWRVIAADQTAKLRLRVVPSLAGFARERGAGGVAARGLAAGVAAS